MEKICVNIDFKFSFIQWRVKGFYGGQIRPKTGAPTLFSKLLKEDFALYTKHCSLLHIPWSRQLLKDDIMHYVLYADLKIDKLSEDGPGF